MSTRATASQASTVCRRCSRRSWLLSELSVALEHRARERGRLIDALALEDLELIEALGGRRREELRARHQSFAGDAGEAQAPSQSLCVHDSRYPASLAGQTAPRTLNVTGGVDRLSRLSRIASVAVVGSRSASDYGTAMARSLARGLAVAGVNVVSITREGVGLAAQEGVLEASAGAIGVCADGLDVMAPARSPPLRRRMAAAGCLVSELPCNVRGRRWGAIAAERIAVGLASVVVVVEATDSPGELFPAELAHAQGRTLAAMPGRITSPLSAGPHALLIDGANLVRGPSDVLELLGSHASRAPSPPVERLEPRLQAVLDGVGAGLDTAEDLAGTGKLAVTLAALGELELMGLLIRGTGGRYLPRDPVLGAGA
jgi:DNA processing protein